jgi:RNA-binding protein
VQAHAVGLRLLLQIAELSRPIPHLACRGSAALRTVVQDEPTTQAADAPSLDGARRKRLRGLAHGLEPVVQVGRAGVTAAVLESVDAALAAHELIKVRLHEPEDKRAAARALADGTRSALVGLIGHTVVLYRPHPESPKIVLG